MAEIVLLGDPRLYEVCEPVEKIELHQIPQWTEDLFEVMTRNRQIYKFGRGIAAPQIGLLKRLFILDLDKRYTIINPDLEPLNDETFELWDDCMSFPNLLVKVQRYKEIRLTYLDENWQQQVWDAKGDHAELIQHEFDHLNGILCTMRAIDEKSFRWKPTPA